MATIECQGFVFDGSLSVSEVDATEQDPDYFGGSAKRAGHVLYGTPRHASGMISIGAKLVYKGSVTACGDGNVCAWKVGFLQAITEARWGARYSDEKFLWWRLNTTNGPLNDGYDSLFVHHYREFKPKEEGLYAAKDCDHDPIAQMFFKEYSGDPFHPNQSTAGEPLGKLDRSEGKVAFRTYLAAVNDRTKSVVTLDECHWTLSWDGTYHPHDGSWVPADTNTVIRLQPHNRPEKYENLTAASRTTPFSLYMEPACRSWEVDTPEGWILWRNHLPDRNPADRPTWEKWAT